MINFEPILDDNTSRLEGGKSRESSKNPECLLPSAIVDAARSLINTPYKHQGRIAQGELDCLGVVIVTAKIVGVVDRDFDFRHYTRSGNGLLQSELEKYCTELPEITEGAIALFNLDGQPNHCAVISHQLSVTSMIHAYENAGRVREHELIPFWRDKIVKIYAFPKVDYR
jgi:cell wall-associated NlpC family hydrolase